MNKRIRQSIEQGHTLVTASNRQAHALKIAYANCMLEEGKVVWRTPDILTWQVWMKKSWENSQADPAKILLNASQLRGIWQSIIESSRYTNNILQIDTIVDTAMRAYENCLDWEIDIFPVDTFINNDAYAFKSWVEAFRKQLLSHQWIDPGSLPGELITQGYKPDKKGIVVYGFDLLTRAQSGFLAYLQGKGCEIIEFKTEARNETTVYHAFPRPDDELRAAAAWARQILATEPGASVGIVVPDLNKRRNAVSAIFDSVLHPDWALRQPGTFQRQYSIAPGRPLSGYPLVHAAIEILSLGYERVPVQRLEFLLRSSFIQGAESEAAMRARFYAALRETGEPAWRLSVLLEYVQLHRQYIPVAQEFIKLLTKYQGSIKSFPVTQTPREWSEVFNQLLKRFGWPGERSLTSIEFQTLKAWRDASLELAGMGAVSAKWDYTQAFSNLKDILQAKSFQPETVETPIQVSGLPGIAGMAFDFVRVTGMHDLIWPGPAIANPFIPLALQQQAGIPGSSAKQVMEQCQQETDNLVRSARHVVFSFARQEGDREYRPSPILRQYLADTPGEIDVPDYHRQVFHLRAMEAFSDIIAPAFSDDDRASGGTGILSDQSACPFRAFAHHRLKAQGLGAVDIGLDPATRGALVHEVMHDVWKRIGTRENLKDMANNKLESLINAAAAGAIRDHAKLKPETFTPEFRRLETRRLVALVLQWMGVDKDRPEFSVSDLEKRHEVNFHGLNLRMRIDRVDELPDGGKVLIDYKTGDVSIKKWEGARPEEPQLPLYAVTLEGNIKAVAFACMKKGRLGYAGLGDTTDPIDGVKVMGESGEAWQGQLDEWISVLGELAEGYLKGHSSVSPTKTACRYCDLHSLCRIHEREWLMADDSDAGDEE